MTKDGNFSKIFSKSASRSMILRGYANFINYETFEKKNSINSRKFAKIFGKLRNSGAWAEMTRNEFWR